MIKTILKVVYVTIAAVLCFILYIGFYNTFTSDYVIEFASTAVKEKDYETIAKVFNVTFDLNSIVDDQPTDKVHIEVLPSISRMDVNTYKEEVDSDGNKKYTATANYLFEYNYSFYLYEPKFSTTNQVDGNIISNKTGLKFYNENNESFTYYFRNTEKIHEEGFYEAYPKTLSDALLKSNREQLYTNELIGVSFVTINESVIKYIESDYLNNQKISKYTVVDSNGNEVFEPTTITLDFTQAFFNEPEIVEFKTKYNAVIEAQKESTDAANQKYAEFEKWYYGENQDGVFYTFYETEAHPTYMHQFDESVLKPASIIWKTIGILALFLLAAVILYILLFHFRFIKRIVTRGRSEGNYVAKDTKNNSKYQVKPEAIKNTSKKEEVKTKENIIDATIIEEKTENKDNE